MITCGLCSCQKEITKPNFIFLFADDQAYNTIPALGYPEVSTPNLDRLAENGTSIAYAFNMGAWHGAVCVASRTMLNTGRTLYRARQLEPSLEQESERSLTWSRIMSANGYETYMTGKWHVKTSTEGLFDHVGTVRKGMPDDTPEGYNRPIKGQTDTWNPSDPKFGGYWEGGSHWSEVVADQTIEFIEDASRRDKPFFMYIAFNAPHDPRQSPQAYVDMYPPQDVKMPASFMPLYPFKDSIGCSADLRDEKLAPFPRTEYSVQVNRGEYHAIISHMDAQIGRIVEALEDSPDVDNTYVIFTADHGLACGNHGLMGKQNMYEHSVRVPWIIAGPGIPRNQQIEVMAYLQDVLPTTLELAGVHIPDHVEFRSLVPVLTGNRQEHYQEVFGGYINYQRMIRTEKHKLIVYPKGGTVLLFDLKKDPLELENLSGSIDNQALVKDLFKLLLVQQKQLGDDLPLSELFPNLN